MNSRFQIHSLFALLFAGLLLVGSTNATAEPAEGPEPIRVTLAPMPEPRPALKYRFTYSPLELRPGNAAVIYTKVGIELVRYSRDAGEQQQIIDWLRMPLEEFPREQARRLLNERAWIMNEVKRAARMQAAEWQPSLDEYTPFTTRWPEVLQARDMGRLLAIEAKLAILEGRYDDAIESIRAGYALGRHLAERPMLVSGLVGRAVVDLMSQQVRNLIQQPDAPNLYWALATMPQPYIEMTAALETEMGVLERWIPELEAFRQQTGSAEAASHVWDRLAEELPTLFSEDPPYLLSDPVRTRAVLAAWGIRDYPRARRELIEVGYPSEKVDAMSVPQVMLLWDYRNYVALRDDYSKWILLPARERVLFRERSENLLPPGTVDTVGSTPLSTFAHWAFLPPSVIASAFADSGIAQLRLFEALRLHGAHTGGGLPASLDEITVVPVPDDPATGEPFRYRLEDGLGLLEGARYPGERYEIRLVR